MKELIQIENKKIGRNYPAFIIAEISANHGQNFNRAVSLIRKAKESGADAVKFQTYTPDTLTMDSNNKYFRVRHPEWGGQSLYQLYKKAYAPWSWFKKLKKIADDLDIAFFSTAFDKTAVDFLEELDVPAHKIASFELVDLPLIAYAARTQKPLILSTGMASISEIKEAVDIARSAGAKEIILLKCVSSYPARPQEMNLRTIPDMQKRFGCLVGFSDHALAVSTSIAAACLGAVVIEKHITLSRLIKTPDSFFSIEPQELTDLVQSIRIAENSLGRINYGLTADERKGCIYRRSLFAVRDIEKGEVLDEINIKSIRPACGLLPKYLAKVIGKRAKTNISAGTPLRWEMVVS